MTKLEIVQRVANTHNKLAQIMVNGDNAILMGDVLMDLRQLVKSLQKDVEAEQEKDAGSNE